MLCNLKEASALVAEGKPLLIAGNANLVKRLPLGNWIGGTTPYLMAGASSGDSGNRLIVTSMPKDSEFVCIQRYGVGGVGYIVSDSPSDGFTVVIMPLGSEVQQVFSKGAIRNGGLFDKAIAGWVSGVMGNKLNERPQVFHGPTGHSIEDEIVALHMKLPVHLKPVVDVINIFEEGDGEEIGFVSDGFTATYATSNGKNVEFAKYIVENKVDLSLPLVATLNGKKYNVSVGSCNTESGKVKFFAPVFHDVAYRFARSVSDRMQRLRRALPKNDADVVFACVCTGNYMDGAFADYKENDFEGPVSFSEIAHLMTNQCIVRLRVVEI